MDILLVSHELGASGAPRALLNLGKALKSLNNDVNLITPFDGSLRKDFENFGINVMIDKNIFDDEYKLDKDFSKYEIIIFNTIVSLAFAKNLIDIPCRKISWVHEGSYAYNLFESRKGLYGRKNNFDFNDLFNYVDEIYCVSEYSKKITSKYTNKNIGILRYYIQDFYNGTVKNNKKDNKTLLIGMYGTVELRKGILLLNEAVNMLPDEIRDNVFFSLCGKITKEAINNKSFNYFGEVLHENLIASYNKIDLLICPSLDDPLPTSVCEALMMGCPTAVSKNTGFSSILENIQYVFNYDKYELRDCLIKIYEERNTLNEMGIKGRKIYEKYFTKEKFIENIKKILKKVD